MSQFTWQGQRLSYWDHPYNNTRNNERAVELPIVGAWLGWEEVRPGLEVGNVLGHYRAPWPRRVVDLYEQAEGVENIDVLDIEGRFPWIVSVSTVEHVGRDDDTDRPWAAAAAIRHLYGLLEPGGRMLVTCPFGYNEHLDAAIVGYELGVTRQTVLRRQHHAARLPQWWPAPVEPVPYDSQHASAAAVWIGEWVAYG
ncbi:MAG: hypothetical protein SHS37scaffold145_68 [Phage 71_18]|nr:MAG: hypothetical protein SHS37scaffold145_68 [Phage 71_18]